MRRYLLKILSLVVVLIGIYNVKSYAAISASSKTVNAGENVSISISSNVAVLSYKVTMTDAGGLTLKTSSGGTGAGTATITDAKATGMKSLATYTFSTPNVTQDTTYKVTFSATAMEDENFAAVADSTATATITVKAPVATTPETPSGNDNENTGDTGATTTPTETKSTNADLSNLGITPNDFKGFKSGTTTYDVTVPNDVKAVSVYATAKDSKSTISGKGYKELEVGKNTVKVVVTAEAGNTKTYTLNITREGDETVVPNTGETEETTENQEKIKLTNIVLDDKLNLKLSPNFDSEVFEYTVNLGEEYKDLEELELTAIANIENAKIEITGNKEFKDGENLITIVVTNPENEESATYKITVNKNDAEEVIANTADEEDNTIEPIDDFAKEEERRLSIKKWTIIGIILAVVIAITVVLVLRYRTNQKEMAQSMFLDEDEDEDDYNRSTFTYENPDILKLNSDFSKEENTEIEDNEQNNKEEYLNGFDKEENNDLEELLGKRRKSKSQGKHF